MSTWAMRQRYGWIKTRIEAGEHLRRADIVEAFTVTKQTASATISEFQALHPGVMRYDGRIKAFVPCDWQHPSQVDRQAHALAAEAALAVTPGEEDSSPSRDQGQAVGVALDLRPMADARRDGTPVLAKMRDDIYPTIRPERDDLERWNGRWVVIHHRGLASDGWDQGWSLSAPVGHGGFPDEWFEGWVSLPPSSAKPALGEQSRDAPETAVTPGPREALEEARDLLMERRYGNPARSPGHNARLCIEAALAALTGPVGEGDKGNQGFNTVSRTSPSSPVEATREGWRLVPVEPSPEMLAAVVGAMPPTYTHAHEVARRARDQKAMIYRAMIAAAPTPPTEGEGS